jgi:hypothetical protein
MFTFLLRRQKGEQMLFKSIKGCLQVRIANGIGEGI